MKLKEKEKETSTSNEVSPGSGLLAPRLALRGMPLEHAAAGLRGLLTRSGWAHKRIWHRWMVKMAWERELCTFIWVLAVVRDRAPCFRHWISWRQRQAVRTLDHCAGNLGSFRRPCTCPGFPEDAHLFLGVDEARSDTCGVDATIGIFMDLDVGPAVAGVSVTSAIKQVKDLLIVELCQEETVAGFVQHTV